MPLFARSPATRPKAAPRTTLLVVERLQGMTLVGWAYNPANPGEERLQVRCGGTVLNCKQRRISRDDVAQSFASAGARLGFELDLPTDTWALLAQGHGLQVMVDDAAIPHAAMRPTPESVKAWLGQVMLQEASIRRTNAVKELQAHLAVAAELKEALGATQVPPPVQGPRPAQVEVWRGLHLFGWVADYPQQRARIQLRCAEHVLDAPLKRVSRQDVQVALTLPDEYVGFELEVPGTLWPTAPRVDALTLEVLVDGTPCGAPWVLERTALPDRLEAALRLHDGAEREHQVLLVMEHLVRSDTLDSLDDALREALFSQARSSGHETWLRQRGAVAQAPQSASRLATRLGPKGRLGKWLAKPERAERALRSLQALRARPALQSAAETLEMALTRATGLFDAELYNDQVPSAQRGGLDPLRHYVRHGDARSLPPNALFDARFYTGQLPGRRHPGVNRVLHYALWGRFLGLNPCAWFQSHHYLQTYVDVAAKGGDPWLHYLNWGWREGRSPHPAVASTLAGCPGLLQRLALAQQVRHPDPRVDDLLRRLPPEARGDDPQRLPWMPAPLAGGRDYTDLQRWQTLKPPAGEQAMLQVIVPVYAGVQETLRCLWSVLSAPVDTPYELVVIDDCSPDPALSDMLRELAAMGLFKLVVNPKNQGFVASVNLGMSMHWDRDVVLLNADTQVFAGWLDRLVAHARVYPGAGSITPLSNNATICSYPRMPQGQVAPDDASEIDRLAALVNRGRAVEAPTGVGFCMWLRRACLDAIGLFDTGRFGRGYGEENDWCQRAISAGWKHLIATDVYVVHEGAVSFSSETSLRIRAAMAVLAERHPTYAKQVDDWIANDPLRAARAQLDAMRLRAQVGHKVVLMVSHQRGGGTARHEREEAERLQQSHGLGTLWLRPSRSPGKLSLCAPGQTPLPNLEALSPELDTDLETVLGVFELAEVQLHHLVDLPTNLRDDLGTWCQRMRVPLIVMVHDYHLICPRITLTDATGLYCGEPSTLACNRCLQRDGLGQRSGDIASWRAASAALLMQAKQVRVPDVDVAHRLHGYFPQLKMMLKPHERPPAIPVAEAPAQPIRRVLVVGALSESKGFTVLRNVAQNPSAREAGLHFTLLGHSMDDAALRAAGVQVLGRYEEATLAQRIEDQRPDLIWLPSIWPETYSYVLSAAMASGHRVAVFNIGAPPRRLRAWDPTGCWFTLLSLTLATQPEALVAALQTPPAPPNTTPAPLQAPTLAAAPVMRPAAPDIEL